MIGQDGARSRTGHLGFGSAKVTAIEQIKAIMRRSPYVAAAEACGFTFGEPKVNDLFVGPQDRGSLVLPFRCVCGRQEYLRFMLPPWSMELTDRDDPVRWLYEHGSFGYDHLRRDGYDHEFASMIDRRMDVVLKALLFRHPKE